MCKVQLLQQTLSKDVYLLPAPYTVQAIVRGTAGSTVTLNANGTSASASVDGLNGATSTVSTDGVVDDVVTGANNGWHKVQVTLHTHRRWQFTRKPHQLQPTGKWLPSKY